MYPVWDKWLMPRCEPIAERFYNDPKKWTLSSYDDDDCFGGDINELPPMGYIRFEYKIAESLDYRLGNLFQLWYEMLRKDEKAYWHISRAKAEQRIEYKWDDFIEDKKAGNLPAVDQYDPVVSFDQRFHYYDNFKDTVHRILLLVSFWRVFLFCRSLHPTLPNGTHATGPVDGRNQQ